MSQQTVPTQQVLLSKAQILWDKWVTRLIRLFLQRAYRRGDSQVGIDTSWKWNQPKCGSIHRPSSLQHTNSNWRLLQLLYSHGFASNLTTILHSLLSVFADNGWFGSPFKSVNSSSLRKLDFQQNVRTLIFFVFSQYLFWIMKTKAYAFSNFFFKQK